MVGAHAPGLPPDASDATIPSIVQNQGIRLGAEISGKALSSAGTSLIGYGAAQHRLHNRHTRYESVTKKSVRSKGGRLQKGTTYLPRSSRAQSRQLHRTRYNRSSGHRGTKYVKSGMGIKGLGKAVPVLAYGYIGYSLLQGENPGVRDPRYEHDIFGAQAIADSATNLGSYGYQQYQDMQESNLATGAKLVSDAVFVGSALWTVFS